MRSHPTAAAALVPLLTACLDFPPIGEEWTALESGTTASLRGVSAVDATTCWASGAGGTWLRTTDAGATWAGGVVPGAEDRDFRDVEAFDADTALLLSAGSPGEVWRTTDGGATWTRTYRNDDPRVFLDAMDFWDDRRGMAFGDPYDGSFHLIETEDGGQSWRRVPPQRLPPPIEGEAGFAASGTCLAVGRGGRVWLGTGGGAARVLYSRDYGRTWGVADTFMASGEGSQGVFSLAFRGDFGWAVGGDYQRSDLQEGSASVTFDGGQGWCPVEGPGYRSCVALAWGNPVSIGKGGTSHARTLTSWEPLDLPGHYALDFAPPSPPSLAAVGWAVGAEGRIARILLTNLTIAGAAAVEQISAPR